MREKNIRSIVKAFSWRITATLTTILISFLITGEVKTALSIGGSEFFIKLFIGYSHERIWNKIKFGIIEDKEPEYTI